MNKKGNSGGIASYNDMKKRALLFHESAAPRVRRCSDEKGAW
ncbi:MAG TPA: hypothetical protein PKV91_02335 [Bacillota bacterium]|nr:hypothetical protein [Bacillota bacterium]